MDNENPYTEACHMPNAGAWWRSRRFSGGLCLYIVYLSILFKRAIIVYAFFLELLDNLLLTISSLTFFCLKKKTIQIGQDSGKTSLES